MSVITFHLTYITTKEREISYFFVVGSTSGVASSTI